MTKSERIREARLDPRKAGEWLRQSRAFEGDFGRATLAAFADCVVEANRAVNGKGAAASEKWSVTLEWSQGSGYGKGILALNFGFRYLCFCRHDGVLMVVADRSSLDERLRSQAASEYDAFSNLPGVAVVRLDENFMPSWNRQIRPAFADACNVASGVYRKLQAPAHRAHAPGLLQFLRDYLNRPEIPNPSWISE